MSKFLDKFKPVTRTINGHTVEVAPLPVRKVLTLKLNLLKFLGKPVVDVVKGIFSSYTESGDSEFSLADLDLDKVSSELFADIEPEKLVDLMVASLSSATVDNVMLDEQGVNEIFMGDIGLMYAVFFFILEVNFKDFFEKATTFLDRLRQAKEARDTTL
jgi:hypothetical protein